MTQEDKELLFKDLCARLPYNVRVEYNGTTLTNIFDVLGIAHGRSVLCLPFMSKTECPLIEEVKPYLFPLLSMSEEQKNELCRMDAFVNSFGQICFSTYDDYGHELMPTFENAIRVENWFNKNHFDYRGLIEKGLAIDATGLNIY